MELEHTKNFQDSIQCWDSLPLEQSFVLQKDHISAQRSAKPVREQTKPGLDDEDSMVDIWDDICMESDSPNMPELEEPDQLVGTTVTAFLLIYLRRSSCLALLAVPTLSVLATFPVDSKY